MQDSFKMYFGIYCGRKQLKSRCLFILQNQYCHDQVLSVDNTSQLLGAFSSFANLEYIQSCFASLKNVYSTCRGQDFLQYISICIIVFVTGAYLHLRCHEHFLPLIKNMRSLYQKSLLIRHHIFLKDQKTRAEIHRVQRDVRHHINIYPMH